MSTPPSSPRHVLVTGCRGGIGAAVCEVLSERGFRVTGWDLPEHDVTDTRAIAEAIERLDDEQQIDALVHTPGIMPADTALNYPGSGQLEDALAVNVRGVAAVCAPVARRMVSRGAGAIVVVSSNAGAVPRIGMAAYGASKAAATSWVRTLGLECAAHGVRCNIVSPGSTDTPMLRGMWPGNEDHTSGVVAGNQEDFKLGIPLRRLAQPSNIATACAFLLSDDARHITMHDLRVDGGATLDA